MAIAGERRVNAQVAASEDMVEVQLLDPDPLTVAFFDAHPTDEHRLLAEEAWSIGIKALRSAFAQADQAQLRDVGAALIEDVGRQLKEHLVQQEKALGVVLKGYFNPEDGQLQQRLKAFIEDDGELARVLKQYVSPDHSVLAETLAQRVGENSPIFKILSPTESEGLVKQLEARFDEALKSHAQEVSVALDPGTDGTPVQRFLASLKAQLKDAGEDQQEMLKALTAAIDPTNDDSLINKLRRDVETANRTLLVAINPDTEGSPMATIKTSLTKLIEKHMEDNRTLLEKSEERQQKFEKEVRESLASILERKRGADRSSSGGLDFEDAVMAMVHDLVPTSTYIVEATGHSGGKLPRSNAGDGVIRFGEEHLFSGCGVVIEAKRRDNFSVQKALEELDRAKKNRECDVGLFVMAKSRKRDDFPYFTRIGSNILVVWDHEDPSTNVYLHAAIMASLFLATRKRRAADDGDITALHDLESRVQREIKRLGEMSTWASNITRDAGKISDEIRKSQNALDLLIRKSAAVLTALKAPLAEEQEEREAPIGLGDESFERLESLSQDIADDATELAEAATDEGVELRRSASVEASAIAARRVQSADDEEE